MAKTKKAEQEDASMDRALALGDIIKKVNKKNKGLNVFANARDDERLVVPRVSSSLFSMDVAMNGGFPIHRMTMIYGEPKAGKTTLFLRGLGNMQKLCGNCYRPAEYVPGHIHLPDLKTGAIKKVETYVIKECACGKPKDMLALWIDAEGVWLPDWSEKMGVWPEKVILMRPTYGEQGYDVITSFAQGGLIDLMAIDSIAAMTPSDELESGMEENKPGVAARMNNKFIRKIISLMNHGFQKGVPMTTWAVNQYRQKIGVTFGSNKTLPGGKGQLFSTSMELEMSPGKITLDDHDEPIHGDFYWTVKKNKLGPSGGKGTFKQWMTDTDLFCVGDLQEHDTVIARAVDMDLVEHPNSSMYHFDGESFRGINSLIRHLAEHPDAYSNLKETMIRKKLGL